MKSEQIKVGRTYRKGAMARTTLGIGDQYREFQTQITPALVQKRIELFLGQKQIVDTDHYAARVANLYAKERRVGRLKTMMYVNSPKINRTSCEKALLKSLDTHFSNEPWVLFLDHRTYERRVLPVSSFARWAETYEL